MVNKKSSAPLPARIKARTKKTGFFDALIIHSPDLTLYNQLQNLISFLLENVNEAAQTGTIISNYDHIDKCLIQIDSILKNNPNSICKDLARILQELIDEITFFINMDHLYEEKNDFNDSQFEILITTKAAQIQWLGVCVIEEIKKIFART